MHEQAISDLMVGESDRGDFSLKSERGEHAWHKHACDLVTPTASTDYCTMRNLSIEIVTNSSMRNLLKSLPTFMNVKLNTHSTMATSKSKYTVK